MGRISQRLQQKHLSDSQQNLDRWLVSYADYMTLMFALFVVLYAMAIIKESPFNILSESLGEVFHISGAEGKGTHGDGILTQQVSESELLEGNSLEPEKASELTPQKQVVNESTEKRLGNPLESLKYELATALQELIENDVAKLELDDNWLTIELSSGMLFASGSASANPSAVIIIEEIATVLIKVNNFIQVRGYTDNRPISNEIYESNWQLSAARAASVTNLLEKFGIIKPRLGIEANASNDPIAPNNSQIGRAKNRRVVVALSKYAYQAPVIKKSKKEISNQISDNVSQDYQNIQIIRLPSGDIRITTRKEENDILEQSD